ncbi:hypothetical protein Fcan01_17728 [Folsomia candida]|uniref:Uncharacterized protein n=1 Tax=Folsomia candida TaxID=158441 RepID=A0A226DRP1_FOLCA|nr:hypothetical protein Fcan01_17728 [Folsomia candida]
MQLAFGENTILEKLQGIPFFGVLVIMIISRWYWPSPSGLNKPGQAINMFVRFKNSSSRKTEGASTLDKLIVICLSVCELSLLIGPFLVILLELHSPCAPPFIGSLSPYCSARVWTEPPILVRSTWMLAEVWFWQQTTYDGTLYIMYALIVPIGGMLDYLQYFQRITTHGRSNVRKNVKATNQEKQTNSQEQTIRMYRSLQLLEIGLNDAIKGQIVPAMIGVCPWLQVFSLFVSINFYREIPLPGYAVFPMLFVDALLCNLIIGTLAGQINLTERVLADMKRQLKRYAVRSWYRKELLACAPLRIKFGQNFIDKGTPLVIEDFCFDQTVNLILLEDM